MQTIGKSPDVQEDCEHLKQIYLGHAEACSTNPIHAPFDEWQIHQQHKGLGPNLDSYRIESPLFVNDRHPLQANPNQEFPRHTPGLEPKLDKSYPLKSARRAHSRLKMYHYPEWPIGENPPAYPQHAW